MKGKPIEQKQELDLHKTFHIVVFIGLVLVMLFAFYIIARDTGYSEPQKPVEKPVQIQPSTPTQTSGNESINVGNEGVSISWSWIYVLGFGIITLWALKGLFRHSDW